MKTYKVISQGTKTIVNCDTLVIEPNGRTFFKLSDEVVHIAPHDASIDNVGFENEVLNSLESFKNMLLSDLNYWELKKFTDETPYNDRLPDGEILKHVRFRCANLVKQQLENFVMNKKSELTQ